MSLRYNHNESLLVKIVYSQVKVNGMELIPLLYADGSLKRSVS